MHPSSLGLAAAAVALGLALPARSFAQVSPAAVPAASRARSGSDFPAERFEPISRTAAYIAAYDQVAWITTDSVVALIAIDSTLRRDLGTEWFAYQADSTWHAVYGRYDKAADRYVQVAHYAAAGGGTFRKQPPVDSLLARRYGRALALTYAKLPSPATESHARFNTYVRPIEGGALELWYLPAWQPNGWLIYGMEFYYRVDSTGNRITDSSSVVTPLQGSRPDTTRVIRIPNGERELPTVGQAFFALYYGRYFRNVYIHSRDFVSTFVDRGGTRAWLHAIRHE